MQRGQEGIAPRTFRPIFVGLSWSADWPRLPRVSDFVNKAHDADEIGLTWANLLVNKVLKRITKETSVGLVLVGHSFGARLLSRAVHRSPLLRPDHADLDANPPVDLFVGLQGAFPYKRFIKGEGREGSPYADFVLRARKFLLTSSAHDRAVDAHLLSIYVGNDRAFVQTQTRQQHRRLPLLFEHGKLLADGSWEPVPSMDAGRIGMLDATEVVHSHNDVCASPIAHFLLRAIARYAPTRD